MHRKLSFQVTALVPYIGLTEKELRVEIRFSASLFRMLRVWTGKDAVNTVKNQSKMLGAPG